MKKKNSVKDKIGSSLMGFVFILLPCLFAHSLVKDELKDVDVALNWDKVPCEVTQTKIVTHDGKYALQILYFYHKNGVKYASHRFRFSEDYFTDSDAGVVNEMRDRFVANPHAECYVKSTSPGISVLTAEVFTVDVFALLFPLMFILVGIIIIRGPWVKGDDTVSLKLFRVAAFIFAGGFLTAGLVSTAQNLKDALADCDGWRKVPCKVEASWVQSHTSSSSRGGSSTSYSAEVLYRYSYNDKQYAGNKVRLGAVISGSHSTASKISSSYRKGQSYHCYVNPENHCYSALQADRGVAWASMFFPIPFFLIGCLGFYLVACKWDIVAGEDKSSNRYRKEKKVSEVLKKRRLPFFLLLVVCSIWGMLPVVTLIGMYEENESMICLTGIVCIMLLLLSIYGWINVVKFGVRLMHSYPDIAVTPKRLRLGRDAKVRWNFSERGISNYTDMKIELHIFYDDDEVKVVELFSSTDPREMLRGSVPFKLETKSRSPLDSAKLVVITKSPYCRIKDDVSLYPG